MIYDVYDLQFHAEYGFCYKGYLPLLKEFKNKKDVVSKIKEATVKKELHKENASTQEEIRQHLADVKAKTPLVKTGNSINYYKLVKDLALEDSDILMRDISRDVIEPIQDYDTARSVDMWKLYFLERCINRNDHKKLTLQQAHVMIKYAADKLSFSCSPGTIMIHKFMDFLVQEGILSGGNKFIYTIEKKVDNVFDYWRNDIRNKYADY